jgi:CIC family chloride channel protein
MFAVVVAYLMASSLFQDSIYSIKLRRKGALNAPRQELGVLDLLLVTDAMSMEYETVLSEMPVEELADLARNGKTRSWLVLDSTDSLVGMVTETDLEDAIVVGRDEDTKVGDIMTRSLITCSPGEPLRTAFRRFSERAVHQIPVVEDDDPGKVAGVLRRNELLWAYKELADEHQRLLDRTGDEGISAKSESVQMELQVREGQEELCLRRIREIPLPRETLIVLLRRGDRAMVPRGDTRVEPGDVLILLTTRAQEESLRMWIGAL